MDQNYNPAPSILLVHLAQILSSVYYTEVCAIDKPVALREVNGVGVGNVANPPKPRCLAQTTFYHPVPVADKVSKYAWLYLVFFSSMKEKKNMFQVTLFSMLHYSISQSNNSIFAHQRTVSCLIVCGCFLPTCLLGPSRYPFAAFLWILLSAVTMVMGPYLIISALP